MVVDVLMDDGSLSTPALVVVGGVQIGRGPFGVWQLDGILAEMGSFSKTGGSSFRETMR